MRAQLHDYRNAIATPRRSAVEEVRDFVQAERRKGRTWLQIARASGRPQAALETHFGKEFP